MQKHDNKNNDLEDDEPVSKSQRKRAANDILDLAKTIVELGDKLFASLQLPESIREAATLARSIKAYGGRKRQILYLGKLMRKADSDAIRAQLQLIADHAETSKQQHKQLERWRDRLLENGDDAMTAMTELLDQWPHADRQQLRQLIRNAQRERERQQPAKSARALFQYLKQLAVSA